jgi:hypothetical protein
MSRSLSREYRCRRHRFLPSEKFGSARDEKNSAQPSFPVAINFPSPLIKGKKGVSPYYTIRKGLLEE